MHEHHLRTNIHRKMANVNHCIRSTRESKHFKWHLQDQFQILMAGPQRKHTDCGVDSNFGSPSSIHVNPQYSTKQTHRQATAASAMHTFPMECCKSYKYPV